MKIIQTRITAILLLLYQFVFTQSGNSKSILFALKEWNNQILQSAEPQTFGTATITENGVSVPSDFPRIAITINDNPDTGYIFLDRTGGQSYTMILNNMGSPVWYRRTWDHRSNFKVEANGMLTMTILGGYGKPQFQSKENIGHIVLDQNYSIVDTIRAINGFGTDEHDLEMLEDGSYFLLALHDSAGVDMSQYVEGGRKNVKVIESLIQEFNASGELMHQWRAWDLFKIEDMVGQGQNLRLNTIDFPHMNAIDIDHDGHILLSSRYLNEITKINRHTGEIIWRLGGKNNQFTFINDDFSGFSCQHDINVLENGHYTIFDNGNNHSPPTSRALEYELDTLNMTATLIWEYQNPHTDNYSNFMGNVQRLPNNNTLINWVVGDRLPILTEVNTNGEIVFEMWYTDGSYCYRAYRFPWDGIELVPYLVIESRRENVVLIFNKFGDPNVDYYKIYGGISPNPTTMIDTSKVTLKKLTNLQNQQRYYFRVTAVDIYGQESDYSNEDSCYTYFSKPGENMVFNGDFSNEKDIWIFHERESASANWLIEDGVSHFNISNGGNDVTQIQLIQNGMEIIQNDFYLFEFDAWTDAQRTIEAMIQQRRTPNLNYSRTGAALLTTEPTHYSYSFKMEDTNDLDASVVFFMGTSNADVYLDNISFKRITESDVSKTPDQTPLHYELKGNYPNPFNSETIISFSTQGKSRVRMTLYNILGKFEQELCNTIYDEGYHQIRFNGNKLSTGIYFCLMEATDTKNYKTYRGVHKMILIK